MSWETSLLFLWSQRLLSSFLNNTNWADSLIETVKCISSFGGEVFSDWNIHGDELIRLSECVWCWAERAEPVPVGDLIKTPTAHNFCSWFIYCLFSSSTARMKNSLLNFLKDFKAQMKPLFGLWRRNTSSSSRHVQFSHLTELRATAACLQNSSKVKFKSHESSTEQKERFLQDKMRQKTSKYICACL